MKQPKSDSTSHVVYFDPTTTASASAFNESTAPNGNLSSVMRNWVLVYDSFVEHDETDKPMRTNNAESPSPDFEV